MKTDSLFYRLFQIEPRSLFELIQLDIDGLYSFESITVKSTEKRIDGFLKSMDGKSPDVFVEVQGYRDTKIYWRFFREICTWQEQSDKALPFIAVILFLDVKFMPGASPLSCVPPNRLICANLSDCLNALGDRPGVLTVLKPLTLSDRRELAHAVRQWEHEIQSVPLPEHKVKMLTELLEYAILERFPKLTLKEVQTMLQLTPLEQTTAVRELMQIATQKGIEQGIEKGIEQGIEKGIEQGIAKGIEKGIAKGIEKGIEKGIGKGELIGKILLAQRVLKYPISSKKELAKKSVRTLAKMFQQMEGKLSAL